MSKAFYSGKKNVSEPKYWPYSSSQHRFKVRIPLNSYYNPDLAEESCNILSKKTAFCGKTCCLNAKRYKFRCQERSSQWDHGPCWQERLSRQFIPDGTLAKLNYGCTEWWPLNYKSIFSYLIHSARPDQGGLYKSLMQMCWGALENTFRIDRTWPTSCKTPCVCFFKIVCEGSLLLFLNNFNCMVYLL